MTDEILLVSHTHWDREWYRTFEAFRARLVDTVDGVLDQLDRDPGWRFLLDGQAIVAEDYLAVRPDRQRRLEAAVASGRLGLGPWYVQPDSLLPSGESHVRNLLEGRRVAESLGGCSRVAYTPDSFGHPAQFPLIFAGFGLGPFVYWRGNGDELDHLGPVYRWEAPDGSPVVAFVLTRGYFSGAGLSADPFEAADELAAVLDRMGPVPGGPAVLMNGVDHMYPDDHTAAVAAALADRTGRPVRRGLLDDLIPALDADARPSYRGELLGGRLANLLPGVWSSRLGLKLADRRAERAIVGWAEPWSALGRLLGLDDEAPSLRCARRALLANQAHDSIGGCSQDEVHRQMLGRYATATELADQTTGRVLERLVGLGGSRHVPWSTELDLAVFNPSPVARTDVVRVALDGFPVFRIGDEKADIHPLTMAAGFVQGYLADGRPARTIRSTDPGRVRMLEEWPALDLELVVEDVPAFGWRRVSLTPAGPQDEVVDDGTTIGSADIEVRAEDDGTLTLRRGDRTLTGLATVEDQGDRGDTYDFDPANEGAASALRSVTVQRHRHPSGIERLIVTRVLDVPIGLEPDRDHRSSETVEVTIAVEARVAPGVDRVDLFVDLDDPARDHRLRLLFPTGAPATAFRSATTFDVVERSTAPRMADDWQHEPPRTFPHQGWIEANGLTVLAPGLPEGEVTPDGTIAVTLLRSVGWLAHTELRTRPIPAGPALEAPEAQCLDGIRARLALRLGSADATTLAADELGLRAVPAGAAPILPEGASLVQLDPPDVALSALKPAEDGDGFVVRIANPTGTDHDAVVHIGAPIARAVSVHLDETPDDQPLDCDGSVLRLRVRAHSVRSVRTTTAASSWTPTT